jgi:hypothetical protein
MSSAVLKMVMFQLADLVYKITASVIAMFFVLLLQARTSLQLCNVGFVYSNSTRAYTNSAHHADDRAMAVWCTVCIVQRPKQ